ncbi:MAG: alpha/beta hydrolase [Pedosphaera sp.]|nr:alpha/beta hydrolase [Pedosphaera sp.]
MLALCGAVVTAAAQTPTAPARLDRNQLLVYRDRHGDPQPVKSLRDWQKRRAEIVSGMESVMGPLPGAAKRCALELKIVNEEDRGAYLRRKITYASEPGARAEAWLLVPKAALNGKRKFPAALCPHPTAPVEDPGYARELAARGYVTLTANYPWLGKYEPDLKALGWQSGTMKAIWDNIRGLDLLDSLPFVKHGKYGAIGHSLGGHNSVYTAVFDERIKVIVSSCGLDSYLDYYGGDPKNWLPERGWCQTRYMLKLADYAGRLEEIPFDFHEMIGALAPREVFISAPLGDSNFKWDSVDRIAAAARPVFQLHGKPGSLRVEHPDCPHDFPEAMRQITYRLLDERLK